MRHNRRRSPTVVVPPKPARSRAIALNRSNDERWWMIIHALLALMAPLLILALTACKPNYMGEPVEYGPEFSIAKVAEALESPVATADPSQTKIGAFVHFVTYQAIAGGQSSHVLSDTGQTVVGKTETATDVELQIVENKYNYMQGGQVEKLSREFKITFAKPSAATQGRWQMVGEKPVDAETQTVSSSPLELLRTTTDGARKPSSDEVVKTASAITYHRLKSTTYRAPAPRSVREAPNCHGLADCQMTFTAISFDQVYWDEPGGERIRFDFVVSPDAPQTAGYYMSPLFKFYPGLVKTCATLMVPVGDKGSRTLLSECQEVVNFRFESPSN